MSPRLRLGDYVGDGGLNEMTKKREAFYAQIVGLVLRTHRQRRALSLQDAADVLGLSASGWSRVETGNVTATVAQLSAMAAAFHVVPGQIVQWADSIVKQLRSAGVTVHAIKPKTMRRPMRTAELSAIALNEMNVLLMTKVSGKAGRT